MKSQRIGFVGIGRLGSNMARRLADLGYPISAVYDHHQPIAASLAVELDCTEAKTLAELTAVSDVIFTVVSDDAAMAEIFTGETSLLQGAAGKTFIHCATLSPEAQEAAEKAASDVGATTLAASIASSITQARIGTLIFMIGGDEAVFRANEELLKDLSVTMLYVGSVGDVARIKAINNMVMNINTAGLAEGLGLATRLGLDLTVVRELFSFTGANSRVLETDGEDMVLRDHACFYSSTHAAKDCGIAHSLARSVGVPVPLLAATETQYQKLIDLGLGELDKSGVAELTFPERAGESLI